MSRFTPWGKQQRRFVMLLLFMLMTIGMNVNAERATPDEMESVCRNWLTLMVSARGGWAGSTSPEIMTADALRDGEETVATCYTISPDGYVVVPALKQLPPVKAYAEIGRLHFDDTGGMPDLLREVLVNRTRMFVDRYGSMDAVPSDEKAVLFDAAHRREWNRMAVPPEKILQSSDTKDMRIDRDAGPLLTTFWHQRSPYNDSCPDGGSGVGVVGCVTLATAQIINYHQWPPFGVGSHTYYWSGDYCTGAGGGDLTADFSDPYVYDGSPENVAELCYEVGVAFEAKYGYCVTPAGSYEIFTALPEFFRYQNKIERLHRSDYSLEEWFQIIQTEIDNDRPILYEIPGHDIVCDGYREVSESYQYHMNYGWTNTSFTTWYTFDNLYCSYEPDSLCPWYYEVAYVNIEPARNVNMYTETRFGQIPLEVQFQGTSELTVDEWIWDFGDGDSAFVQAPTYIYDDTGRYTVSLEISSGGETYLAYQDEYVIAFADSLMVSDAPGKVGQTVEVTVSARNAIPLRTIQVPLAYDGDLELVYDSFSTAGCRTEDFYEVTLDYNANKKLVISMLSHAYGEPDQQLQPGVGNILKLYFTISAGSVDQTASLEIVSFDDYEPYFTGGLFDIYTPLVSPGLAYIHYVCGDANGDEAINLLDILFLIDYVYGDPPGVAPDPIESGDPNADGNVNLLDLLYIIDYLYGSPLGPEPLCP